MILIWNVEVIALSALRPRLLESLRVCQTAASRHVFVLLTFSKCEIRKHACNVPLYDATLLLLYHAVFYQKYIDHGRSNLYSYLD